MIDFDDACHWPRPTPAIPPSCSDWWWWWWKPNCVLMLTSSSHATITYFSTATPPVKRSGRFSNNCNYSWFILLRLVACQFYTIYEWRQMFHYGYGICYWMDVTNLYISICPPGKLLSLWIISSTFEVPCADTNSSTAVAAEARVNPALTATAVVEFMAKRSNLCPLTV